MLYRVEIRDNYFLTKEAVNKTFQIGLFYFNYFYLLPRFFEKRKLFNYFAFIVLLIGILGIQQLLVERYFFIHRLPSTEVLIHVPVAGVTTKTIEPSPYFQQLSFPSDSLVFEHGIMPQDEKFILGVPKGLWLIVFGNAASSALLLVFLGSFIRLTFTSIKQQDEKKALENANLNAEVNLLRSQINPHFLFNTLNSIYAQAHARSSHTEYSVLKLSDIFRYVLYDSAGEKICLEKDIRYISNYIDLQRLRISNKVNINYKVNGESTDLKIAPLLLISFIENAFKYGVSYVRPSTIDIILDISEGYLCMFVSNPIVSVSSFDEGGIGLKNAKRRLELLYPNKYSLEISEDNQTYIIDLKIDLK